jgi:hypothetical protein
MYLSTTGDLSQNSRTSLSARSQSALYSSETSWTSTQSAHTGEIPDGKTTSTRKFGLVVGYSNRSANSHPKPTLTTLKEIMKIVGTVIVKAVLQPCAYLVLLGMLLSVSLILGLASGVSLSASLAGKVKKWCFSTATKLRDTVSSLRDTH